MTQTTKIEFILIERPFGPQTDPRWILVHGPYGTRQAAEEQQRLLRKNGSVHTKIEQR